MFPCKETGYVSVRLPRSGQHAQDPARACDSLGAFTFRQSSSQFADDGHGGDS